MSLQTRPYRNAPGQGVYYPTNDGGPGKQFNLSRVLNATLYRKQRNYPKYTQTPIKPLKLDKTSPSFSATYGRGHSKSKQVYKCGGGSYVVVTRSNKNKSTY